MPDLPSTASNPSPDDPASGPSGLGRAKYIFSRCFADRHDGWMGKLALGRDRVQMFDYRIDTTDFPYFVLFTDMVGNGRRCDKEPGSCLSKCFHQGAVVKFSDDSGAQIIRFKPVNQLRSNGLELLLQSKRQVICANHSHRACAQQVAASSDVQIRRHRSVGDDHVESMDGQLLPAATPSVPRGKSVVLAH